MVLYIKRVLNKGWHIYDVFFDEWKTNAGILGENFIWGGGEGVWEFNKKYLPVPELL